ncbi:MAG: POTRA domain-containing protein [Salinibacter sp.]
MTSERSILYPVMGTVLLLLASGPAPAWAQSEAPAPTAVSPTWELVVDGSTVDWPGSRPSAPADSARAVAERVLDRLRRDGYYYARIDSAEVETTARPRTVRLYAHRGPQVTLDSVQFEGVEAVPRTDLRRLMETEAGRPLDPRQLEADIQSLLDRYERAGHPLAEIHVAQATVDPVRRSRFRLVLRVEEGPELWLKEVETGDQARTNASLLAHLADRTVGEPLTDYDPEALRERLEQSPLFRDVGDPDLRVDSDGGATLRIPVEETPPGSFDLVLGYLPASAGQQGQFIGSGHLLLEHLFGGGRQMDLALDRRPGRASVFDLSVTDPFAFGLPLRIEGAFQGEQRDSTFGERHYGGEVGYRFEGGLELVGSLSREVVQPGPAGAELRSSRQRIARSRTLFYGVGIRYDNLRRPANPRRGGRLEVQAEQGESERTVRRRTSEGDTTRVSQALQQERLHATARTYVPLFARQVLVVGADAAVLRSESYDRSDLFRFGGATSLRGYDEDRFLGNMTARGLLEYRLLLDPRSYVYTFGDLGYVRRPALQDAPRQQSWRPGYGIGVQVHTGIGQVRASYALNPEVSTPADGRMHIGLSVAL